MFQRIVFCFFLLIGLTANFQKVNAGISGKVFNQAGKPVANAILTLAGQGIKDTSGSDGSYSLTTTDVKSFPSLKPQSTTITLSKDLLEFSLLNPSPVKVEIFDIKGNLLRKELLQNAQAGFYRFNIAENSRTANLLIIHASIGQREMTFRYNPINNGRYNLKSPVENSTNVNSKLAKIAAIIDTLKVTATNYRAKSLPVSSYDTTLNITLDSANGGPVTVQLDQTRQVIAGFGINNVWRGGWSDQDADKLFDSTKGLGLTILRIGMGSDGNVYNGTSCWDDIKKAKARGLKYVIGSTWSPPGDWKTAHPYAGGNAENDGGYLKPEYYGQWSDRIAAFPAKVKAGSGYDLYAMSIGNEPDFASCGMNEPCNGNYVTTLYNDTQMVNFIKVAGPKLHTAGCKVIAPEASEWLHIWSDSSACCSVPGGKPSSDPLKGKGYDYGHALFKDKTAWAQLDILGVHQYDTQVAESWPSDVTERKPVWQTEMSGVKWWPDGVPDVSIDNGIAVAKWLHNALTVGEANGWCYWWWQAMGDTNEGLLLANGTDTKRHYTFGNFTKFVRPGYTRIDITGDISKDVLLSAYKGADGTVVVVAINKGTASATVPITISGGTAPSSVTPWVTSADDNLVAKTAITVSGGIFTATLASKTVTTFVGK
jgi:glucuronoarabinoxylan endo-1,4-beta-xylanase